MCHSLYRRVILLSLLTASSAIAEDFPATPQGVDAVDRDGRSEETASASQAYAFDRVDGHVSVRAAQAEEIVFPADAGVVDVTQPPYGLKGDGQTDNTAALRRAFDELRGSNSTLFFPNGTYLFGDRINISGDELSKPHSRDRFLNLQGQSQAGVVLRLKPDSPGFGDADKPKTFISLYEGRSTGDAMHTYVRNLTIEIGEGNPGASALRFLTNNSGAIYDVTLRSLDSNRRGAIGLDLRQSQQGPGLIKRVTVEGFDHAIELGNSFSMVFEHITLQDFRRVGFANNNARSIIRNLVASGSGPAITNGKNGNLTLVEAELSGTGDAAIVTGGDRLFVRDVRTNGYDAAVRDAGGASVSGPLREWFPGRSRSLFDAADQTLRLPIEETPEVPWQADPNKWVKVEVGQDTLQRAIDQAAASGATTVYFPKQDKANKYVLTRQVRIHGSVNRIIGMENILWIDAKLPVGEVAMVFEDLDGPLVFERFFNILKHGGWGGLKDEGEERYLFENRSDQPIVIRNIAHGACVLKQPNPGKTWYLEDVVSKLQVGRDEKVWARQLNPESPEMQMVVVDGGQVWILGMKTEGRAAHIVARNGAKVELLGGVSYQSWKNQPLDPPMFTVVDSDASFTFGFYHWNLHFTTIVEETRGGKTRTLARKELERYHLPLYRAGGGEAAKPQPGPTPE